jgi:hypothetical protein
MLVYHNRKINKKIHQSYGPSWPWSYGSWIYNYQCNQCLSPLMLWVRISIRAKCRTLYTYWLCMRVMTLLFSTRYQLFSEATPRKIKSAEGSIKVLLPEYQIYMCIIILNNYAIQNFKLGPFLMDFQSTLLMLFKTNTFSCVHLKKNSFLNSNMWLKCYSQAGE